MSIYKINWGASKDASGNQVPRALEMKDGLINRADIDLAAHIPSNKPGYAKGCMLQASDTGAWYQNTGTSVLCTFTLQGNVAVDLAGLTATSTELNKLAGSSFSATELGNNNYSAGRIVDCTATQLTVTAALHDGKDVLLDNTHTVTVTLPAASGSGSRYNFIVHTAGTDGSKIVTVANTTDIIYGGSLAVNTQSTILGFLKTNATTITFNNTTQGGLIGSRIELVDVASGKFAGRVFTIATGNPATPFS